MIMCEELYPPETEEMYNGYTNKMLLLKLTLKTLISEDEEEEEEE